MKKSLVLLTLIFHILSASVCGQSLTYADDFNFVPINAVEYMVMYGVSEYLENNYEEYPKSANSTAQLIKFPTDIKMMIKYQDNIKPLKQYYNSSLSFFGDVVMVVYGENGEWINGMELIVHTENNTKLYGYKDSYGNIVIPPVYKMIMPFHGDIARAELEGKYGFLNKDGNIAIPFDYDFIWDFYEEAITPACLNGSYGYIDNKNNIILPFEYKLATPFINKTAIVMLHDTNKFGVIDMLGNFVIPPEYNGIDRIEGGLFKVLKDRVWGVYDSLAREIIPIEYNIISEFHEGISIVKKGQKYGAIDIQGNMILSVDYDNIKPFSDGMAAVLLNGKWGYIDKNGGLAIDYIYNQAEQFGDGLAAVRLDDRYGFINKNGETVIPFEYYWPGTFSGGYALVGPHGTARASGGSHIIDKSGNIIYKENGGGVGFHFTENGIAAQLHYVGVSQIKDPPNLITTSGEDMGGFRYLSEFENGSACFSTGQDFCYLVDKRYIPISVNGKIIKTDTQPVNINDRVLCPVRVIMEELGCFVFWDEKTEEITVFNDEKTVILKIGSEDMTVKDNISGAEKGLTLDSPPIILNDRALLPIRAVSEQFEFLVDWSEALNMVKIKSY